MKAFKPEEVTRDDAAYVFHYPRKFLWSEQASPPQTWGDFDIYLHVPFCRAICTYCTFERRVHSKQGMALFLDALKDELRLRWKHDDFDQARLGSIYLGGGTASLMPNTAIGEFLAEIFRNTRSNVAQECTLECEPTNKRESDYRQLRELGINRISIGAQTFSDDILKTLNRSHTADQTKRTVSEAQSAGIPTVHLDLMYGLPDQTIDQWEKDLRTAVALGVQHISAYELIVFEGETLSRQLVSDPGHNRPSRDTARKMRILSRNILEDAGFFQYSLTEFGRGGSRCEYVIGNWTGRDYLGFGPAAYSRKGLWLWENSVLLTRYGQSVSAGTIPVKAIEMTPEQAAARDIAMGLCLLTVDLGPILDTVDERCREGIGLVCERLTQDGLLWRENFKIGLTADGLDFATHVMHSFLH